MNRRARRAVATASGALALLALGACGQTRVPQENYYRLEVDPLPAPGASIPLEGTLVVERFSADGLTSQRPVVYALQAQPHNLHQYSYHFWTDAPPRMLQELTVDVLRAARVAQQVVTPETRVVPAYTLNGKIRRLEHVRGAPDAVVVEIELTLHRAVDGELVWLDQFSARETVPAGGRDGSVSAAMVAMSRALGGLFRELVASLARRG